MEAQTPFVCPVPPKPFNHVPYSTISMVLGFLSFPIIGSLLLSGDMALLAVATLAAFWIPVLYVVFYAVRLIRHSVITKGKGPGASVIEVIFYLFLQLCLILFFLFVGAIVTASVAGDDFKAFADKAAAEATASSSVSGD
jgi:hypothetical protein